MEIILIRHGLPVREERKDKSMADPPLAEIGLEQASRMANWLAADEKPVNRIIASPRLRARETAADLAKQLGIEPEIVEEFAEIDRSSTIYIPIEQMRREKHPQWEKLVNQKWEEAGFMDPAKFQEEVLKGFTRLVEGSDPDDKIAVVCHGGTINAIVSSVLKLKDFFFFEPAYTSITRIKTDLREFGDGKESQNKFRFRVFTMNETGHLHANAKSLKALPAI